MEYIKESYNMPFLKKGMRVKAIGKDGVITGTHSSNLKIRIDGEKKIGRYHPTYETIFYDENGNVLSNTTNIKTGTVMYRLNKGVSDGQKNV